MLGKPTLRRPRDVTPIPKLGRGLSRLRHPTLTLADVPVFKAPQAHDDPDMECHTWPDLVDQTRIHLAASGYWAHDDMENDDGV